MSYGRKKVRQSPLSSLIDKFHDEQKKSHIPLCENLNLFATDPQLCYLLSRYDDCCFFSPTIFSLFLSCLPLFPESPLSTFRSFSISCDFHACSHCERALFHIFSWHPNVFGNLLKTSINKKLFSLFTSSDT